LGSLMGTIADAMQVDGKCIATPAILGRCGIGVRADILWVRPGLASAISIGADMGLDAVVFCDCVEKGCLRVPHPYPRLLYIANNGSPEIRSKDPVKVDEHDKWMNLPPCEHEGMMLPGSYGSNMNHISYLYRILSAMSRKHGPACPVLLGKVTL
jgi:hypothetical protein